MVRGKKSAMLNLWLAAACRGMLQNPHQQLPEPGVAACSGMPRHPAACGCRWCLGVWFKAGAMILKVLPWVVDGAGGLGAGKTSGAGTRGVSLNVAIGGRTGYSDTNGGESSNN